MNVGVIGLGAMGLGMAQSLRRGGHAVSVCDLRAEVVEAFVVDGGHACANPAELAAHCDVVVSVLVNLEQTEQVLFGPNGVAAAMRKGSVFVMCSTVPPEQSRRLGERMAELGLLYLDAPVSGGEQKATAGSLTFIVGGSREAQEAAAPALASMAEHVFRVGEGAGAGSTVKLINQLLVAVHMAVAAEAMALARRQGIDLQALYDVITRSFGNSVMFEQRAQHIVRDDYTSSTALDILVKDLGLVLDTARASQFPLPLSSTAHQMYLHAAADGYGREASAAVAKIFPGA